MIYGLMHVGSMLRPYFLTGEFMSGIFGYALTHSEPDCNYLERLSMWNDCYGREGYDTFEGADFGCGAYVEHLSDRFDAPSPVLRRGDLTAVIDAVLYCRSELLAELSRPADDRISDEELLLDFIQRFGYSALARVNGDFAGAVYDSGKRCWTLFRDHSGVRTLFYYLDESRFVFSTDLRAILAIENIDHSINDEALYLRMMGYNELTLCQTQYKDIHCIRPAAWTEVTVKCDGLRMDTHTYWKWRSRKIRLGSDAEYQRRLRELITDAIQRRLDACPGPVGCELSGGLDSSVIAILINRLGRKGCYYSWSYSTEDVPLNEARDERSVIRDICEQEQIECAYAASEPSRSIDMLLKDMLPPYINTRSISCGSRFMRNQGARVVFTGHGGDEGVSHRANNYELWYHGEYLSFLRMKYRQTKNTNLRLLRTIKNTWSEVKAGRMLVKKPFYKEYSNAQRALLPAFVGKMKDSADTQPLPFSYDPALYVLQGGHRVRLDNVAVQGAEQGVRYMLPFIDYRVLDFAFSIPRSQYKNEQTNRYIYRAAFDDIMPESLRNVRYKDMPSLERIERKGDPADYFRTSMDRIRQNLDRDFWKDYLDFDYIINAEFPQNATPLDYSMSSALLNQLSICCAIEYVCTHAPEGRTNEAL